MGHYCCLPLQILHCREKYHIVTCGRDRPEWGEVLQAGGLEDHDMTCALLLLRYAMQDLANYSGRLPERLSLGCGTLEYSATRDHDRPDVDYLLLQVSAGDSGGAAAAAAAHELCSLGVLFQETQREEKQCRLHVGSKHCNLADCHRHAGIREPEADWCR